MPPLALHTLAPTPLLSRLCRRRCIPLALSRPSQCLRRARYATAAIVEEFPRRELIVLEPPGRRKPLRAPAQLLKHDLSLLDLAGTTSTILEYERVATLDATQMEISLLRPHELHVSEQRFKQLADQLFKAYNKRQLLAYLQSSLGSEPPELPKAAHALRKNEIVGLVLTRRWGIAVKKEIAEREDVLVVQERHVSRKDIFFLITDDGKLLREWAHKLSARITVNLEKSLLKMQASQASLEKLEYWIQTLLDDLQQDEVDLSGMQRLGTIDESTIMNVARMTSTFIEKADNHKLRIWSKRQLRLEDARRLLFSSLDLNFRTLTSLGASSSSANPEEMEGTLFPVFDDASLPWTARNRKWARWRQVKSLANPPDAQRTPAKLEGMHFPGHSSAGLETLEGVLNDGLSTSALISHATESTAILGYVFHDSATHTLKTHSLRDLIDGKLDRTFCSSFPGLPHVTRQLSPLSREHAREESYLIRLVPSPWSQPTGFEKHPPVEVTLGINENTGEPVDPKIQAIDRESLVDVMLPQHACDIRFRLRNVLNLPITDAAGTARVQTPELDRFLSESHLNRLKDYHLRPSSTLKLELPLSSSAEETESVAYTFAGLEYRVRFEFDWKGLILSQTVIEGGISGGSRTELSLRSRTPEEYRLAGREDPGLSPVAEVAKEAVRIAGFVQSYLYLR